MKDQYFGDINDYRKYGLIRQLNGEGDIKTGICWMLTPPDGKTDGKFVSYLSNAKKWKKYDPSLYEFLHKSVAILKIRQVKEIENSSLLKNTIFYSEVLKDKLAERQSYFKELEVRFGDTEFIFFDPDNGLEVKSKPVGRKNSSKYLYWNELSSFYSQGKSILVYQHFPFEKRDQFIERISEDILNRTFASKVYSYRTPYVVFFLACQKKHIDFMEEKTKLVVDIWGKQIKAIMH